MFFSDVKAQCLDILNQTIQHPFNQELAAGNLAHATFCYYIEQDAFYLEVYAQAFALIAAKIAKPFRQTFIEFTQGSLAAEQTLVHDFFKSQDDYIKTKQRTLATEAYTDFLLARASFDSAEVVVAAVLPCFWVYWEVAFYYKNSIPTGHPYSKWFDVYASEEFDLATQKAISIFNELAGAASPAIRDAMFQAFRKACVLEWHFWNDAYAMRSIEQSALKIDSEIT